MLGRGLESLIPKKSGGSAGQSVNPTPAAPVSWDTHPALAPYGAPAPVSVPTHTPISVSVTPQPVTREREAPRATEVSVGEPSRSREPQREAIFHIEVDRIRPNPYQPRKFFNDEDLDELASSIREFGILQPLVVSKVIHEVEGGTSVEYQLIAGERRLMAAKRAGLERVPAIVKGATPKQTQLELALIENIQRSNLNSLESAKAYARLQDEFNLTQREVAARVGKSREAVANTLRLLQLPSEIQDAVSRGTVSESQARTLLGVSDPNVQKKAFERILGGGVSVRALRTEVQKPKASDPEAGYWEKKLEEFFGAPVDVQKSGSRGKVTLHFYSEEEWRGILDKIIPRE